MKPVGFMDAYMDAYLMEVLGTVEVTITTTVSEFRVTLLKCDTQDQMTEQAIRWCRKNGYQYLYWEPYYHNERIDQ